MEVSLPHIDATCCKVALMLIHSFLFFYKFVSHRRASLGILSSLKMKQQQYTTSNNLDLHKNDSDIHASDLKPVTNDFWLEVSNVFTKFSNSLINKLCLFECSVNGNTFCIAYFPSTCSKLMWFTIIQLIRGEIGSQQFFHLLGDIWNATWNNFLFYTDDYYDY